jgi:hypothetical protein
MNAGTPWRAISASRVVSGTSRVLLQAWPSHPRAPCAARKKSSDAVETVGLARLILSVAEPAACPTATGSIVTAASRP